MQINAIISARILALVANGMEVRAAFDQILGEGAFLKMAGDLYDALNVKAAAKSTKH